MLVSRSVHICIFRPGGHTGTVGVLTRNSSGAVLRDCTCGIEGCRFGLQYFLRGLGLSVCYFGIDSPGLIFQVEGIEFGVRGRVMEFCRFRVQGCRFRV